MESPEILHGLEEEKETRKTVGPKEANLFTSCTHGTPADSDQHISEEMFSSVQLGSATEPPQANSIQPAASQPENSTYLPGVSVMVDEEGAVAGKGMTSMDDGKLVRTEMLMMTFVLLRSVDSLARLS